VNRALAGVYRSGEIVKIFGQSFGNSIEPSPMLTAMYVMNALPE